MQHLVSRPFQANLPNLCKVEPRIRALPSACCQDLPRHDTIRDPLPDAVNQGVMIGEVEKQHAVLLCKLLPKRSPLFSHRLFRILARYLQFRWAASSGARHKGARVDRGPVLINQPSARIMDTPIAEEPRGWPWTAQLFKTCLPIGVQCHKHTHTSESAHISLPKECKADGKKEDGKRKRRRRRRRRSEEDGMGGGGLGSS